MFASAFILTVLACSPDGLVCRPTATEAQFASLDACRAAISSTEESVRASFPADTRFSFKGGCVANDQAEANGVAWAVSASGEMITSFDRLPAGSGVAMAAGAAPETAVDATVTASIEDDAKAEADKDFNEARLIERDPILRGNRPSMPEQHAALNEQPLLVEAVAR